MKNGKWEARIRRAEELASAHSFAAEGLRFYQRLAQFQKSLYAEIEAACGTVKETRLPGTLRQELDVFVLLPRFAPFLALIEQVAPAALAGFARELRGEQSSRWQEMLRRFWEEEESLELEPAAELVAWLFLQPYAEYLADHSEWGPVAGTPSVCPRCGARPLVGVLRPEGDGAKRSLVCALCMTEWDYRRIVCPACGEEDVHKLAVYTAQEIGHVRVEACDGCRSYIKTVDLTKNGRAVPVVDELAAMPLDLWAAQQGYTKLRPNLLGI